MRKSSLHRLIDLNIWSLVGGIVWGRIKRFFFLEEWSLGMGVEVSKAQARCPHQSFCLVLLEQM